MAADKLCIQGELRIIGTKIIRATSGEILAWTGASGGGLSLVNWFEHGRRTEDWPERQKTDDWTRLIVANKKNCAFFYEREPFAQTVVEPFMAWGSGCDFAMGAMAQGADAKQAVEVANRFSITCGGGVEFFDLNLGASHESKT